MSTPAGWYDDGSGNRRWWDGARWTEHVVTAPQPRSPEPEAESAGRSAEPEPFAPPYTIPSSAPAAAVPTTGGVGSPPAAGAPWVAPAAPPTPARVSVLGVIGLAVVVIGVVCACIPVIAIAGWIVLGFGFLLSLISLFLPGRRWPGITGMAVAAVGAVLALAVSLVLGVASSALRDDGSADAEGQDPSSIEGAEMTPFAELEVGDCLPLVDYGDEDEIYELPVVPCEQPHTDEVYLIFDLADGEFPGDDALARSAWDGCLAEFETFVGTSYEASELDFYTYQPTESSWIRADDRTVQCILFSYEDVTGTLEDARR